MLTNIKRVKLTVGWGFCMGLLVAVLVVEVRADAIDKQRVADHLKELRSDEFAVRERAQLALYRMGPAISHLLREARTKTDDAELRLRLDQILIDFVRTPITKGQWPLLSPNGASLAFVRWVNDPNRFDVWIRDLRKGTERLLVRNAVPATWTNDSQLAMQDGTLLDVKTGIESNGASKLPDEMAVKNVVLAPGGKRLVYVPDIMFYWRMDGRP